MALGALQGAPAGTRLAAASAFWHPADPWTPEWRDFQPRVLACLTDDAQACEAALARLDPGLWDELEEAVASLDERRCFPGLYRLDPTRFRAFA